MLHGWRPGPAKLDDRGTTCDDCRRALWQVALGSSLSTEGTGHALLHWADGMVGKAHKTTACSVMGKVDIATMS